jgi:hypothetical protein
MPLHALSHCLSVGAQAPVLVFETYDGQVFIRRGVNGEDEVELTIHEYDQFITDVKTGRFDRC